MTETSANSSARAEVDFVMPVYNEGANIGRALAEIYGNVATPKRVLIVYDFDEDDTLPAVRELLPLYPGVELVKNTLGRGVLNAIRSGIAATTADVVIITMADLSDDLTVVPRMVSLIHDGGYDIVCASRYMRGGRQIGGPWFKGLLSRMAGLSLYWVAGLPTHDATNAFRAYRREVLLETVIESKGGFEYSLEITAKAYAAGRRIAETPSTWRDRSAGQSRFKLFAWLPHYLRWYFYTLTHRPHGRREDGTSTLEHRPAGSDEPDEDGSCGAGRWWHDVVAAVICVVAGVLMSMLPHLERGSAAWFADHDNLMYLAAASQAYHHHPTYVADPMLTTGRVSLFYPWLQFVPAVVVAKVLGLGTLGINLVWRAWAGVSIALGWYLVLRQYVRRPWVASALAILLVADTGVLSSWPVVKHFVTLGRLAAGWSIWTTIDTPYLCVPWRIITPGLSLGFLLLYLGLLGRAVARPSPARIVGAGLAFGLLFYAYFYFWTAAGLGLVTALVLDSGRRWTYFHVGWIGGLVGLPIIVANALYKASYPADWLQRIDFFQTIGRFTKVEFRYSAVASAVIATVWVWSRRRDLVYLWALAVSSLVLTNHHILTKLQIQNSHWYYACGPCLTLLILLLIIGEVPHRVMRTWLARGGLVGLCAVQLLSGLWMRSQEADRTRITRGIETEYHHYRAQRLDATVPRLVPDAVLAGARDFVDLAAVLEDQRPLEHYAVLFTPAIVNAEWRTRIALDSYLQGLDHAAFDAEQRVALGSAAGRQADRGGVWGPWMRDPAARSQELAARLDAFDAIAADPDVAINRFQVRYVALPADRPLTAHLDTRWRRLQDGPYWQIWGREVPSSAPMSAHEVVAADRR